MTVKNQYPLMDHEDPYADRMEEALRGRMLQLQVLDDGGGSTERVHNADGKVRHSNLGHMDNASAEDKHHGSKEWAVPVNRQAINAYIVKDNFRGISVAMASSSCYMNNGMMGSFGLKPGSSDQP